ncbi:DMT family transporter [Thermotoga sp. KOL6]|uniref:DMT family transporter n=1 Tax=Thermotoga sp. KOL6 TaxID=126741 RepID=UPI000C783F9F|nr:DMT family transporter [Thermotoga sp. KOL6]PLV59428.1 hypothetical protein AS005_06730 [Thermotoga sp. KOL6]
MWRGNKALLFLLLTAAIQGSTFPLQKLVVLEISPFAYNTIRFGSAAVFSLLVFGFGKFFKGFALGIVLCGSYIFQIWGLKLTSATKSGFIISSFVFLVPVFAFLLEKEKLERYHLLSFLLGVLGIYILTGGTRGFSLGDLFQVFCAILFALHVVLITKFSRSEKEENMLFWQFATVAGVNLVFSLNRHWKISSGSLLVGLYSGILATFLGIFWQMRYQKEIGNNATALVYMTQPFISTLLSFILLEERLSTFQFFGGILTLVALFVGTSLKGGKSIN